MLTGEELFEIRERMGEEVHTAWMEKRKKEKGWHSPEDCPAATAIKECMKHDPSISPPMRDSKGCYCVNCHPCMVSYAALPDSEKELDRQYPALFLNILTEMGYEVVSKKELNDDDITSERDCETIKTLLAQRDKLINDLATAEQYLETLMRQSTIDGGLAIHHEHSITKLAADIEKLNEACWFLYMKTSRQVREEFHRHFDEPEKPSGDGKKVK